MTHALVLQITGTWMLFNGPETMVALGTRTHALVLHDGVTWKFCNESEGMVALGMRSRHVQMLQKAVIWKFFNGPE